ncbi:hypothetical protein [uncultured Rikenella sp.]|nr:hypothetical protein [uncultured Rikenella sp.]
MDIGNCGYNWSSSKNGINGLSLYFHPTGFSANGETGRVNGLPLRCLSE